MGRRILLVEGRDDKHVVRHLCRAKGIDDGAFSIEIAGPDDAEERGGIEQLVAQIPPWLKSSDLERLAILVDADADPEARWQSIRDRLRNEGFPIPDRPNSNGTIIERSDEFGTVAVSIWIMPDNTLPGMIETFLAQIVPENDAILPYVDSFIGAIPEHDRRFAEVHRAKARIHSFLAVQNPPGRPLGLAISFRFLDPNHAYAGAFTNWLRNALAT